jgi:hypothetical protein
MRLILLSCLVSSLVTGCATTQIPVDRVAELRTRAASDLSCPQELLRITPMGEELYEDTRQPLYQEVEGCSMHVIYTATKDGYVMSKGGHPPPSLAPNHVDVR